MSEGYSWALTGYVQKYPLPAEAFGQKDVERIFCLEPDPPAVDNLNDYILTALREKNLDYLSFFLHRYERILNRRIRSFLIRDGSDPYDPERFLDIKLACRMKILEKLADYDLDAGTSFTTFLYPHISDALLEFRKGEGNRTVRVNVELTKFHEEVLSNLNCIHGALLRMNRSIQAEGSFGGIKWNRSYTRARRRGLDGLLLEIGLISCGFNLHKYHLRKQKTRKVA